MVDVPRNRSQDRDRARPNYEVGSNDRELLPPPQSFQLTLAANEWNEIKPDGTTLKRKDGTETLRTGWSDLLVNVIYKDAKSETE